MAKTASRIVAELKAIYWATDADVARRALEDFDAGVWGPQISVDRAELAAKLGSMSFRPKAEAMTILPSTSTA